MLISVPMQLIMVHACTASQRLCTSPSGQAAQDCTQQPRVVLVSTSTCCEMNEAADEGVIRTWESQAVLAEGGAPEKAM